MLLYNCLHFPSFFLFFLLLFVSFFFKLTECVKVILVYHMRLQHTGVGG